MLSLSLTALALPVFASALGFNSNHNLHSRHSKLSRSISHSLAKRATYSLEDYYQGEDFLDQWDFFSSSDPTHGQVNYLTKSEAVSKGLAFVSEFNSTILQVDNTTWLGAGEARDSVRISSKKQYNGGLFIADFSAMPTGCSLWPAYWSVGDDWPNNGEIDVVEGVNQQTTNQMTLHTSEGCSLDNNDISTGRVVGTTCASSGSDNNGCGIVDTDSRSFGQGFNEEGGGVFAHLWDASGINIWFFSRCDIPDDISDGNPDPDSWGSPSASFPSSGCDISEHFVDHSLVFDTTLCGDWAGATFNDDGCSSTCSDFVQDPSNFATATWDINYIAVYQTD